MNIESQVSKSRVANTNTNTNRQLSKGAPLNMAKLAAVKVTDGKTDEAIIDVLKSLIEKGVVDDLIVPKALPSGEGVVQTLIRDPRMLGGVCALSPTMPVQSARVVSNLTVKSLGKKVGAVMKSCEIRAIVELTKFLQVKLDNLYLIGIDCPGTFEVPDYARMVQEGKGGEKLNRELLKGMERGRLPHPRDMPSVLPARCANIQCPKGILF